ncbi:hypothetical protein [Streptomyces hydrogenans]|uniref:Uncharacterized protein n=2 Tax=Streptomyces hydrogenans TaxID=1873719 RepID=A0ABQ3PL32_9ACTN|nr:hypothetical protein [Streptomyces hydrogenans]GHG35347.1 hypothetical protein GCM10018784_56020 [Streptomyces hydrogenans]GHI20348.1 hypothetical protein Shyd_17190 [Streptomyces hydrogenans]GHI20471.1 hypothetical protein Shyd_18420 [Streptomyces hydrogenans]GHI20484.1 hypothetical protein Shyd_18550 [Streptomyces hydrogenans]GHI22944.1 hypothetical protein Shyd_43150 [Streptomyces hydrogenans]
MTNFAPGAVLGVPVWLAVCALVALSCILALVGFCAGTVLRRADQRDLPQALLGLSHVISAMCGLLPWGKPTPPPALPEQAPSEAEPPAAPTVVLVREQPAVPVVLPRDPR